MKHIYDLNQQQTNELFMNTVTLLEKLDGSFIKIGRDKKGIRFVQRKDSATYHHIKDWSIKSWTNTFRHAHSALEQLLDTVETNGKIPNETEICFEIIDCSQPNTVVYKDFPKLIVTSNTTGIDIPPLEIKTELPVILSLDGKTLFSGNNTIHWKIDTNKPLDFPTIELFDSLQTFLDEPVKFGTVKVPRKNIIWAKINKRPDFATGDNWKEEVKNARTAEYEKYKKHVNTVGQSFIEEVFKDRVTEGIVFETTFKTKIFDSRFKKMNKANRLVKNILLRKRTAPLTIDRLDYLLKKYIQCRFKVRAKFKNYTYYPYKEDCNNNRILSLFAEIRRDIIDGRQSI